MDNRKFNDQEEVRRNYLKELQASNNDPFINERFISQAAGGMPSRQPQLSLW
jgi:hypothetical protein